MPTYTQWRNWAVHLVVYGLIVSALTMFWMGAGVLLVRAGLGIVRVGGDDEIPGIRVDARPRIGKDGGL